MPPRPITRLRKVCLALPEAREVEAWGEPTWRVKKVFAMYASAGAHHGAGRDGVWIKSDHANQDLLVSRAPDRFFVPPYVGPAGWVGAWIDGRDTDWQELEELLNDGWRMIAPKKLLARYEEERQEGAATAGPGRKRGARGTRA